MATPFYLFIFFTTLIMAFFLQRFILVKFLEKATNPEVGPEIRNILLKLCSLYGAWSLEQHLTILYQGKNLYFYFFKKKPGFIYYFFKVAMRLEINQLSSSEMVFYNYVLKSNRKLYR